MSDLYQCDNCDQMRPRDEMKTSQVYSDGIEGSFCHECRHGKNCDCQE